MKKAFQKFTAAFLTLLSLALILGTRPSAQAQYWMPQYYGSGISIPTFNSFWQPMARSSGFFSRYLGLYPFLPMVPPMLSTPQPAIRRSLALTATTITSIKIILPPASTIIVNPYIAPVATPLSAISIPVTTVQAQPILLAAGVLAPADTATAFLFNILAPTLGTPTLASILPASVLNLLSFIP